MTQEQKRKKDLEAAKDWLTIAKKDNNTMAIQILEDLFPELRESDDERIKKAIMHLIKSQKEQHFGIATYDGINWLDMIAWLEKQGKQKPDDKVEPKFKVGDWIVYNDDNVYQVKETDYTNIIPRYELESIDGDKLSIPFTSDYNLKNWTIQDAKDGDVLYSLDSNKPFLYKERPQFSQARGYCCINEFGEFAVWNTTKCVICTDEYIPTTKGQRDILFQKMEEAGYKWDADKKELTKIKQNPADSYCQENCKGFQETGKCFADGECDAKRKGEQNSAWSEEDEHCVELLLPIIDSSSLIPKNRKKCKEFLKSLKDRVQSQPKQDWSKEDEANMDYSSEIIGFLKNYIKAYGYTAMNSWVKWLNSLKSQPRWKPTEEQMQALNWIAYNYALMNKGTEEKLQSLYNGLKKL